MSKWVLQALIVALCLLIVAAPAGWAYWVPDGAVICAATGVQEGHQIAPDGAGGAIITWIDLRGGSYDIYAQRVNALGVVQWTVDGVAICTATGHQYQPQIISDGAGGAIITWDDGRSGLGQDIYAQRVNASGNALWAANGVGVCTAAAYQVNPLLISDGAGGAIIVWNDHRIGNNDLYAQRVNASGAPLWTANGVVLCTPSVGYEVAITSDGAGGAIVAWIDYRSGSMVFAQRASADGVAQWTANGVYVSYGATPTMTSDGMGGAIIAYGYNSDIYLSRLDASGIPQWTAALGSLNAANPEIASDGAGGALVAFRQYDQGVDGDHDVLAGYVTASGTVPWPELVDLSAIDADHLLGGIISDEAGGALVTWSDNGDRNDDYNIYAQRINASGAIRWQESGVALCTAAWDQISPKIVPTGTGGAIIAWVTYVVSYDIYAQRVDSTGSVGTSPPNIQSVLDVPNDQGGCVRITIERSGLDNPLELIYPVSRYDVWQRIDDPSLLARVSGGNGAGPNGFEPIGAATSDASLGRAADALIASGWPVRELNGRCFVESRELLGAGAFPPGAWELLGSFAATQQSEYVYRASALADSTASGIPYSVYVVSAHTTTPTVWYVSYPDSGYSVDNLPPEAPGGLLAEQSFSPIGLALSWDLSAANDISHYAVYRGSSEGFVPSVGNRVVVPIEPEWFDGSWRWSSSYHYKISAVDIHGNESGFTLVRPDDVTGGDTPKAPEASYLSQNYPNPFNPRTRIAFGLSEPGHVSLRVFDAAGRLVRALADEERREGRYEEVWDGKSSGGHPVSTGIYFYRLRAGAFEDTKKMILVR
jgi:hypothetical protein